MSGWFEVRMDGFEDIEDLLEAFEEQKPFPLNVRQVIEGLLRHQDEPTLARILRLATILHEATSESTTIWQCLYAAKRLESEL